CSAVAGADEVIPKHISDEEAAAYSPAAKPFSYPAGQVPLGRFHGSLYNVRLERTERLGSLGLSIDVHEDLQILIVAAVNGGLAELWNNSSSQNSQVRTGDCIVEVNGIQGPAEAMLERCRTDRILKLTLQCP
ncbi:unnamed protein product, partial [Polarella glacialis]